jgi:hypothetical protein
MSRIGTSLFVLAVAGLLVGGSAFAQTPSGNKPGTERNANKKAEVDCKKQATQKNLTGPERKAFRENCEGPKQKK